MDIRSTKFPLLLRIGNPCDEASFLLALREMQKDLDDASAIDVQMLL